MSANPLWPRLVADIGGTNARFALEVAPQQLQQIAVLPTADYPNLLDAIRAYLAQAGQPPVRHAALAIANPIVGDWVQMTNHHWAFSMEATRQALAWDTLLLLNDFTAQALSVPLATTAELVQVGGMAPLADAPKAVLGPGTGLGVSGLIPGRNGFSALAGEGGHVSFAPFDDTEVYLWQYAKSRYGHVSAERLLSGAGLSLIYEALAVRAGADEPVLDAARISALAQQQPASLARQSLDRFCAILGTVAADLALTLGARGGVYLCGGMLPRFLPLFRQSPFRRRFEDKGRFADYLAAIPVYVVLSCQPGLHGAAVALARHLQAGSATVSPAEASGELA